MGLVAKFDVTALWPATTSTSNEARPEPTMELSTDSPTVFKTECPSEPRLKARRRHGAGGTREESFESYLLNGQMLFDDVIIQLRDGPFSHDGTAVHDGEPISDVETEVEILL